jgi:hypothetical protein
MHAKIIIIVYMGMGPGAFYPKLHWFLCRGFLLCNVMTTYVKHTHQFLMYILCRSQAKVA